MHNVLAWELVHRLISCHGLVPSHHASFLPSVPSIAAHMAQSAIAFARNHPTTNCLLMPHSESAT